MKTSGRSIKKQYSLIFGMLLFGSILFIGLFNMLTLRRFYQYHKERVLLTAYDGIKQAASYGDLDSEAFSKAIDKYSSIYNVSILIFDAENQNVRSNVKDAGRLANDLLRNILTGTDEVNTVYQKDNIEIHLAKDERLNLDYLELWGNLDSSNFVIMRCNIQSISEATRFSNHILIMVGLVICLVGIFLVWIASGKLTMPINELVKISEKMTRLDFSEKYQPSESYDEIDILGNHINILSENLEKTILELKAANMELKRDIDRKTEIDEMRKEFVSNVSHELKTPIALIQGYAEGLKDCVNDDEESKEFYCDVIIDEASKMNRLVRNLLNLNELECGYSSVDIEHFDIIELIYNCVSSYDILIKGNNIKMELPSKDLHMFVWADEFMVENIINNYVSNAIHYAKGEKVIRISFEKIGSILRIGVFNTGDNIPDNVIDNVWTKFYKADKARTREYGGSGIGLSIVKASMDALGHDYGVDNKENGVLFWFELDADETVV